MNYLNKLNQVFIITIGVGVGAVSYRIPIGIAKDMPEGLEKLYPTALQRITPVIKTSAKPIIPVKPIVIVKTIEKVEPIIPVKPTVIVKTIEKVEPIILSKPAVTANPIVEKIETPAKPIEIITVTKDEIDKTYGGDKHNIPVPAVLTTKEIVIEQKFPEITKKKKKR